jgi:hypothetical protein
MKEYGSIVHETATLYICREHDKHQQTTQQSSNHFQKPTTSTISLFHHCKRAKRIQTIPHTFAAKEVTVSPLFTAASKSR